MIDKLLILFLLFIGLLINAIITYYFEIFAKSKVTQTKPLYDIGHAILPNTSKYRLINDIIASLYPVIGVYITYNNSNFKKILTAFLVIFFLRIITAYVTVFPPSHECQEYSFFVGGCHDKMFSGHLSLILLTSFLIMKEYPKYTLHIILFCILYALQIIASRDHYTVDVFIATFIATLIGKLYKFI